MKKDWKLKIDLQGTKVYGKQEMQQEETELLFPEKFSGMCSLKNTVDLALFTILAYIEASVKNKMFVGIAVPEERLNTVVTAVFVAINAKILKKKYVWTGSNHRLYVTGVKADIPVHLKSLFIQLNMRNRQQNSKEKSQNQDLSSLKKILSDSTISWFL